MKNTIISLKIELMTRENVNKVIEEFSDDLEGAKVVINTCSGETLINECVNGHATYISEIDEYEEEVLLDYSENKLEYRFIKVNDLNFNLGDIVELMYEGKSEKFEVFNIAKRFFLYNSILNICLGETNNFGEITKLRHHIKTLYPEYKVYKLI